MHGKVKRSLYAMVVKSVSASQDIRYRVRGEDARGGGEYWWVTGKGGGGGDEGEGMEREE